MTSPMMNYLDDKDLDDAALWAAIDSAAAASAIRPRKHLLLKPSQTHSPHVQFPNSPDGEVLQGPCKPPKSARFTSPLSLPKIKHRTNIDTNTNMNMNMNMNVNRNMDMNVNMNTSPVCGSPETRIVAVNDLKRSDFRYGKFDEGDGENNTIMHSLSGRFPTVSLFKEYQNAAMAILEKGDYTMISGHPFIKKTGWRKISCYFNMSYEIRDKTIEFDEDRNVIRAEFVVRALMQGGRFSDGWGSCERREKRFSKPNHDIPSTAETRAKNKACQDLLGIGEYRPGASHAQ